MAQINAILFDLSEVYLRGQHGMEDDVAGLLEVPHDEFITQISTDDLTLLFRGEISEDEYWNRVIEENGYHLTLNSSPTREVFKTAIRKNVLLEIEGTGDIIRSLKQQGYSLGLVSDHAREWVEYLLRRYPLDDLFDSLCFSYEIGRAKRAQDPEINIEALKRLRADPEKTLYIDDKPGNVELATSPEVGIAYGHVFADAPSFRIALEQDYQITV